MVNVCVVGAGVVGLTTATILQETRPDIKVTVIADKFTIDTLSDGAAGIFRPSSSNFRGPDDDTTKQWVVDSYSHYTRILDGTDSVRAGVKTLSVVVLSTQHQHIVKNALLEEILPEYKMLATSEIKEYSGGPYKYGCTLTTLLIENKRYLPYLMDKFKSRGGVVVEKRLNSLLELHGDYDAVVNCSGLGARQLCGDTSLTPMRGQVMKVRAPWIKQCYYSDFDTYIIPGFDLVTLGGCRQFDSWNPNLDKHDSNAIWERCLKLMPSLRNAEIVREWTGLRPYRPVVRVEKQLIPTPDGGMLKVVHNYGHGGYGVTCAPGTSIAAVRLLVDLITPRASKL